MPTLALCSRANIPNFRGDCEFALRDDALASNKVNEGPQCRRHLAATEVAQSKNLAAARAHAGGEKPIKP